MWNYSVTLLRSKFCLYVVCIPRLEKKKNKLQIYCLPNKKLLKYLSWFSSVLDCKTSDRSP